LAHEARARRLLRGRVRAGVAFRGGAFGASIAVLIFVLARAGGGSPGILEVISDAVVRRLPPPLLDWGITVLGPGAKGLVLLTIMVGTVAAGGILAAAAARHGPVRPERGLRTAVILGLTSLAFAQLVVLPVAGAGIAGSALLSEPLAVHVPLVAGALAYGITAGIWSSIHAGAPQAEAVAATGTAGAPGALHRRAVLGLGIRVLVLSSIAASGALVYSRTLGTRRAVLPGQVDAPGAEGFGFIRAVTPVPEFYVVSKDWVPLEIDPLSSRFVVEGLVDAPRAWTLDELRALPAQEGFRTLQCISAESITRSELIGNQRWKGVRVSEVLRAARPDPAGAFVVWRCADGYHESLDLATALHDDTWLVYEMGPPGTLLTPEHGRPLRLLVAGRYGMAQPKYLTSLTVTDQDEPGWWVRGGWRTDAPVRTYCRIDLPAADGVSDSVVAGHTFTAYGVASAGDRGISAVQVSLDGGSTWSDAELEPLSGPIGRLTWVRWRMDIRLGHPGSVLFMARAADGTGTWQDDELEEPFPRGASGYPRVAMRVYPPP
jgi:DMSO/TMAO reductase YedYZ molybdopterin-dependent catalytic subunit